MTSYPNLHLVLIYIMVLIRTRWLFSNHTCSQFTPGPNSQLVSILISHPDPLVLIYLLSQIKLNPIRGRSQITSGLNSYSCIVPIHIMILNRIRFQSTFEQDVIMIPILFYLPEQYALFTSLASQNDSPSLCPMFRWNRGSFVLIVPPLPGFNSPTWHERSVIIKRPSDNCCFTEKPASMPS